ncbi:ACT domain-containing protein [Streptomyces sp. NBC_00366]
MQPTVIALWALQVPLIFPESRGDAAESGEAATGAEGRHVAAGGGQEPGVESDAQGRLLVIKNASWFHRDGSPRYRPGMPAPGIAMTQLEDSSMAHDGDDQGNGADSGTASPGTPPSRRMTSTPSARTQNLRVLEGRFVLGRVSDVRTVAAESDLLALVLGPDGGAAMRRDDTAEDGWVALWNGDDAHDPEATGMLSAIVAPLAASGLPVWTAASHDGDLVLVPAGRLEEAVGVLRRAGHQVAV